MVNKGAIVLGSLAVGGALIFALSRKASGAEVCYDLQAGDWYYFVYTGPAQTFQGALGECYDVIYTIDVWDDETGEYNPPVDPMHDVIQPGSRCRVKVQGPCKLCGFVTEA